MAKFVNKKLFLINIITITVLVGLCSSSAIPMWEYLSRGEKMSHLYTTFAKQVSTYCKTSGDAQPAHCKRELLMYGLGKLHDMSESHLDSMDPYQRGANDIIWDSMMDGHPSHPKKEITTPPTILLPTGIFMSNPLFDDKPQQQNNHNKYDEMESSIYSDSMYTEPQNYIPQEQPTNLNVHYAVNPILTNTVYSGSNYLSGPMVIRVRPDGTPVEEDRTKPLPRDDDRSEMVIGREKLPTMEQIANIFRVEPPTTTKKNFDYSKYSTYTPSGFKNYRKVERYTNYH